MGLFSKPKPPTLTDRIVELIGYPSTKVELQRNRYLTDFDYSTESSIVHPTLIKIEYNNTIVYTSSVREYISEKYIRFIISEDLKGASILPSEWDRIFEATEDRIKRDILSTLYPFKSPELEELFNDVRTIEDGKEQIRFILDGINRIRDNY